MYLGYTSNDHGRRNTNNCRNSHIDKNVQSDFSEVSVSLPCDKDGALEPQVVLFIHIGRLFFAFIRHEYETKDCVVYVILCYDFDGIKEVLGL
ncbi:hypothetical protein SAMN04487861_11063 [Selenomonas ruminantium]|uniref:Uncharacterized protein n=1 Tax=Selenomonas ruminantium TaxID=971 RepID=A0A1I3EIL9_SELRU|nr:hypothetical protein SAMN04487861_11063 [Selenomonas ruminantium]